MNIIIKLIRHRNHGGYKSVMTSYACAVQLIQLLPLGLRPRARAVLAVQPSRMSNNLYLSWLVYTVYNVKVNLLQMTSTNLIEFLTIANCM